MCGFMRFLLEKRQPSIPYMLRLKKNIHILKWFFQQQLSRQEWIRSRLNENDLAIYFPVDLMWIVWRILSKVKPKAIIIVETEIWPNFWWLAHKWHIPLALINARISDHSYKGYLKFSFFIK